MSAAADVPPLYDIEIVPAARSQVSRGLLAPSRAEDLLAAGRLGRAPDGGVAHLALLERVSVLRDNVSAYDAIYALAETLDAVLITADRRPANAVAVASPVASWQSSDPARQPGITPPGLSPGPRSAARGSAR